jgi:hypothetical protein
MKKKTSFIESLTPGGPEIKIKTQIVKLLLFQLIEYVKV